MPDGRISRSERGVLRRGRAAMDWFATRGAEVRVPASFQVHADVLRVPGFEIARIWHTAGRVVQRPGLPGSGCQAILQLEGNASFSVGSSPTAMTLVSGSSLLLPASDGIEWVTSEPVARIEIRTDRGIPQAPMRGDVRVVEGGGLRASLVAMVNVALSSDLDPRHPGFRDLRIAAEHLLSAVFREQHLASAPDGRQRTLFDEALALIRREARDPQLTVDTVARRLSVSERTLRRAFAHHGTSVRREIGLERARSAQAMFAQHRPRSAGDLRRIAAANGYSTVRAMRESIRRHVSSPAQGEPAPCEAGPGRGGAGTES